MSHRDAVADVWPVLVATMREVQQATVMDPENAAETVLDRLGGQTLPTLKHRRQEQAREVFEREWARCRAIGRRLPVRPTARLCKTSPRTVRRWVAEKNKRGASVLNAPLTHEKMSRE